MTIQVTLKLYASLSQYLPADVRSSNRLPMEVAEGTTIHALVEPFGLPQKLVHLVLVNGHFVPPEERATRALVDGDVLAIWPPIAGG